MTELCTSAVTTPAGTPGLRLMATCKQGRDGYLPPSIRWLIAGGAAARGHPFRHAGSTAAHTRPSAAPIDRDRGSLDSARPNLQSGADCGVRRAGSGLQIGVSCVSARAAQVKPVPFPATGPARRRRAKPASGKANARRHAIRGAIAILSGIAWSGLTLTSAHRPQGAAMALGPPTKRRDHGRKVESNFKN